jgi:hypothetical protein
MLWNQKMWWVVYSRELPYIFELQFSMVYYLDKVLNISYQPDIMITYAISKSSHITDMIITDMKKKFEKTKCHSPHM